MKTIFSILFIFALILSAGAQDGERLSKAEIKKFQKEQKKADKETKRELMAQQTKLLVETQQFVLEADWLSDNYGNRIPVTSTINFVMVDSSQGVMQLGNAFAVGYNGVGGTTIEGRITDYTVKAVGKKKNAFNISIDFQSSLGTYNVNLMVGGDGSADANIRSNWPGQINYHGDIVPLGQSRIWKGSPSY